MIHRIFPHKFFSEFGNFNPQMSDYIICYNGAKVLLKKTEHLYQIPKIKDILELENFDLSNLKCHYLFRIDDIQFFLEDFFTNKLNNISKEFEFVGIRTFRDMLPIERMGGATACHIAHWEFLNQYCGQCGTKTSHSDIERALVCPKCKNIIYPKISPVVIVAVHNGNKLLMAHNIDNPNPRLFLISGFVEIGESLEQAAKREVFEETGIHIKNISYFGSQPWPFSDSIIAGFTAELDGCDKIQIQKTELSEALWVKREDIPEYKTDVSISCCLIENFRRGYVI